MSTNYYALNARTIHIGKSSNAKISTMQGSSLRTIKEWEDFLNDPKTRVEDEYGVVIPNKDMIDKIKNTDSSYNIRWLKQNGYKIYSSFQEGLKEEGNEATFYWLDQGTLFNNAEFF